MDLDANATHVVEAVASALNRASDALEALQTRKWTVLAAALVPLTYLALVPRRKNKAGWNPPPLVPERIPFVSNGWAFVRDPQGFLDHVARSMRAMGTGVATVRVGPMAITVVAGAERVGTLFRAGGGMSPDRFLGMVMEHLEGMTRGDLARYEADGSGRGRSPKEGWEGFPEERRVWARQKEVVHVLGRKGETAGLAERFQGFFDEGVRGMGEVGAWREVRLAEVLRREMAGAAGRAMVGTEVFGAVPDLVERFWAFDAVALRLIWGLPRWLDPGPRRVRDEVLGVLEGYLAGVFGDITLDEGGRIVRADGTVEDPDWEPTLGSRYHRAVAAFGQSAGLSSRAVAGGMLMALFGLNSNSIPIALWAVFELVKDEAMYAAVRDEVAPALSEGRFDVEALARMPLLQAVYLETMRLHVAISITREATEDVKIDGYDIPKGRIVQAPTSFGAMDEGVWGEKVGEWLPGRHLRVNEQGEREFRVAARAAEFFPYGGGATICGGRQFAKQEIMLAVAVMVSRFDMEFVAWTMPDGRPSGREARGDSAYVGAAAVPPDRDMRVRWRRLW